MSRKLVKNSIIYSAVSVVQKAVGFFLLPIYAAFMPLADFGTVDIVNSLVSFLSVLTMLGLNAAAIRMTYRYRSDEAKIRRVWGTLTTAVFGLSVAMTASAIAFGAPLFRLAWPSVSFAPMILLGLATCFFSTVYQMHQAYLQCLQEGGRFGANNLFYFLVNISLTLLLVAGFRAGAGGALWAKAVTSFCFFCLSVALFLPRVKLGLDGSILREAFIYSLPIIPHTVIGFVAPLVDRAFISNYRDAASTGLYSAGFQLANVLNTVIIAVNQAYGPWFMEQFERGEAGKKAIRSVSVAVIAMFSLLAAAGSLFSKEAVTLLLPRSYADSWKIVPILASSYLFNGVYFLVVGALFLNATKYVPVVTLVSTSFGLIASMLLVPRLGIYGAAVANLVTLALSSFIAGAIAEKVERIGYRWIGMYGALLLSAALGSVAYLLDASGVGLWPGVAIKAALLVLVSLPLAVIYRDRIRSLIAPYLQGREEAASE